MRLFLRLLIGNIAPVIVVTAALAFMLVAVVRMTTLLQTLGDTELSALRSESEMHHACWTFDVTMRRAERACVAYAVTPDMKPAIVAASVGLAGVLRARPDVKGEMPEVARHYLELFESVQAGDLCDTLLDHSLQRQRSLLDERLTNSWERRLDVLYAGVAIKEERARDIGVKAASAGMLAAAGSILLALLLARNMARSVNLPLSRLATLTRQVGRGDFSAAVEVRGPAEIEALARELEQMRTQLAKLDALKQGFLASVSHELRTPLSKIREALALLSDGAVGELEPRQARVVGIARTACEREIRLVTSLLDLSRMRTGNPLRFTSGCSIDDVLESAVNDERGDAVARDVALVVERQGDVPRCRLDAVLLERALANLVRNAVSVSQRGQEVRVLRTYEPARGAPATANVKIAVVDQGPGVPREIRADVFQAFVTRSVPGSPKALGVGLGLALAREVARAHGGDLILDDNELAGATFTLSFPIDVS